MSFSERNGYIKVDRSIQRECLSADLRREIWDSISIFINVIIEHGWESRLFKSMWINILKRPLDEYNGGASFYINEFIKNLVINGKWNVVLDTIEFIIENNGLSNTFLAEKLDNFIKRTNAVFEKHYSGYRIIENQIVEIDSKEEIEEIEQALNSEDKDIRTHLQTALKFYSDRNNLNYRNSIKESISAVESLCRKITGKSTLGDAIHYLNQNGILNMPETFLLGLEKIYAFTNGKDGIRHALSAGKEIHQEDAKFMLVMCSSFVNYITEKNRKNKKP